MTKTLKTIKVCEHSTHTHRMMSSDLKVHETPTNDHETGIMWMWSIAVHRTE